MRCQARQFSDGMTCAPCGLAWDVNDPDRPPCATKRAKGIKWIRSIRERLSEKAPKG
jgi:hypothetical protein